MRLTAEHPWHPCPRCGEDFAVFREYREGAPAKPRRFFGLLAAVPARPAQWRYLCGDCEKVYYRPFIPEAPDDE